MVPAFLFEKKLAQAAAQQMRSPTGRSPPCPPPFSLFPTAPPDRFV